MSNFNFTSQVCTSTSQSEQLLALGLKKKTADCQYAALVVDWKGNPISNPKWRFYDHNKGFIVQNFERIERIPAWSLHRLIEMMPSTLQDLYELDFSKRGVYYADFSNGSFNFIQSFAKPTTILYDNIINCIEWLIKEGYFNKEYLE